jgi:hypothetical protein
MTTGLDHPAPHVEYTLDGAAVLSVPAGQEAVALMAQLRDEGFVNLVRHWYDVATDRDFAEYRRVE